MGYDNPQMAQTAAALAAGKPAVYPTETVYGIGVAVGRAEAPDVLFDIKRRPHGKPVAWLVGSVDDLARYGSGVPDFAQAIARTFWPGPLTLIVNASEAVPPAFRSQEGTIGLRMPDNRTVLELIERVGAPLATTSANFSGCTPPQSFDQVDPELLDQVAAFLDDDEEKSGVSSTVLDCTKDHPVVVREGAITIKDIAALC